MQDAACGMEYVHRQQLIHHDLRATTHAFERFANQRTIQWELEHRATLTNQNARKDRQARINRAQALLDREEEYYQQFVAQEVWPETRPGSYSRTLGLGTL